MSNLNWEKRKKELIESLRRDGFVIMADGLVEMFKKERSQTIEEIKGKIEKKKKDTNTAGFYATSKKFQSQTEGYNQALTDILNSLK